MSECSFFAVRELQSPRALWGCHGSGDLLCRHWKQGEGHKEASVAKTFPAPSCHRYICVQTSHMQMDFSHMYATSQLQYSTTLNPLTFLGIEFLSLLVQNR